MYLVLMTQGTIVRRSGPWVVAAVLLLTWFGLVLTATLGYRGDAEQFDQILSKMVPGQRAMALVFERDSDVTIAPTFLHFVAWYSATRGGVVDPSFANTFVQPVLYRHQYLTRSSEPGIEWRPDLFSWSDFRGDLYRYFIVRSKSDRTQQVFRGATCAVSLKARAGMWWLYETDPRCVQPS
jgi:hypothetical protein